MTDRRALGGLLAVLAMTAAVYAPTLNDYFAGDDFLVIGPAGRMGALEAVVKAVLMRDGIPYWRPLVTPIYALYVHGFGLHPAPYHLVVLALHLTNVALVALVAWELTGRRGVALAAALLFGVHAAHTLTVAQISSTVELLCVVWYLTAVLCALRWLHRRPAPRAGRWYAAALLSFVLALLSKESGASAAGVLTVMAGLWLLWPARQLRLFVRAVAPVWLLVLPYIALTYVTDTDDPSGIARLLYAPGAHVLRNLWWLAARLAAPLAEGHGPEISPAGHAGAAVLLIGAVAVAVHGRREARLLVAWTLIALTPLTLWRSDMMLGRFTYQAAAPFAVLCAWAGAALLARVAPRVATGTAPALLMAAAALMGTLTVQQNRERTREADAYRLLVSELRRAVPAPPAGSSIVIVDGTWSGPFHALYLEAVAETLYRGKGIRLTNLDADQRQQVEPRGADVRLRFTGSALVAEGP